MAGAPPAGSVGAVVVGGAGFVVGVGHDEIPAVHAVGASVGDGVAGLEFLVGVAEQMAGAAAVHTHDRRRSSHGTDHTDPMRVVAGTAGGLRLEAPDDESVRPTSDRVREATFNALFSLDAIGGATVVDLFAGSGALGIEALSRGAERAVFVERSPRHAALVERNLVTCGFGDRAEVVVADGPGWLAANPGPWDLVLLDPPYAFDGWPALLDGLDARVVVVESDRPVDPGPGWHVERNRRYGATVVALLTPGQSDLSTEPPGSPTP